MIEDEMVGWHHQFNGHVFEQTMGITISDVMNTGKNEVSIHMQARIIKDATGVDFITVSMGEARAFNTTE